jgi:hypothetical protein
LGQELVPSEVLGLEKLVALAQQVLEALEESGYRDPTSLQY